MHCKLDLNFVRRLLTALKRLFGLPLSIPDLLAELPEFPSGKAFHFCYHDMRKRTFIKAQLGEDLTVGSLEELRLKLEIMSLERRNGAIEADFLGRRTRPIKLTVVEYRRGFGVDRIRMGKSHVIFQGNCGM